MQHDELKDLTKGVHGFPLLLTHDMNEMRGHNFRSRSIIALLLCKPFKNTSNYQKALTRVGRGDDRCCRIVTEEIYDRPIGESEEAVHRQAMSIFYDDPKDFRANQPQS